MAVKRSILGIILLVLYVAVGIPIISRFLLPLVIDFIGSGAQFLQPEWCSTIHRMENGTVTSYVECAQLDLRPVVLFLVQVAVYVVVPLGLVFGLLRRR